MAGRSRGGPAGAGAEGEARPGEAPPGTVLPVRLVARGSSGPPRDAGAHRTERLVGRVPGRDHAAGGPSDQKRIASSVGIAMTVPGAASRSSTGRDGRKVRHAIQTPILHDQRACGRREPQVQPVADRPARRLRRRSSVAARCPPGSRRRGARRGTCPLPRWDRLRRRWPASGSAASPAGHPGRAGSGDRPRRPR